MQGSSRRATQEGEGVQEGSVALAGRKTLETLGAADSIAEALEMAAHEQQRQEVVFLVALVTYGLSSPEGAGHLARVWALLLGPDVCLIRTRWMMLPCMQHLCARRQQQRTLSSGAFQCV